MSARRIEVSRIERGRIVAEMFRPFDSNFVVLTDVRGMDYGVHFLGDAFG